MCAPAVLHREPEIPSVAGRERGRIRHFTKRERSLKIKRGSAVERVDLGQCRWVGLGSWSDSGGGEVWGPLYTQREKERERENFPFIHNPQNGVNFDLSWQSCQPVSSCLPTPLPQKKITIKNSSRSLSPLALYTFQFRNSINKHTEHKTRASMALP